MTTSENLPLCSCGHSIAEHGEDGCYTFLFDPEHRDLVRYCDCRIAPPVERWSCTCPTRCADAACPSNPVIQRWIES